MKVGLAQIRPHFARPEVNRRITRQYCIRAARREIQLLVFPELCITGYNFSSRQSLASLAEPVPEGPTIQLWCDLARKHELIIVGGLAELGESGQLYNSAVIIDPEGFVGRYRKIHLFFREQEFFDPGKQPPQVFEVPNVTIGVLICFDWAFSEVARILMLEGCEVLCLPASLILPYAQQVMIARSIENRFFTVTANRVGTEENLTFTGHSQITDVTGRVLVRGPLSKARLLYADIDPQQARDKHLTRLNDIIQDRRIELYQRLVEKNSIKE